MMWRTLSKLGLMLIGLGFTCLLFVVMAELVTLYPFPTFAEIDQHLASQKVQGSFAYKLGFYQFLMREVWLFWLIPAVGFLGTWLGLRFLRTDNANYEERIHFLEQNLNRTTQQAQTARHQLDQLQLKLEEVYEDSAEAQLVVQKEGKIEKLNHTARKMLSLWSEQTGRLEQHSLQDLIPGYLASPLARLINECLVSEQVWQGDVELTAAKAHVAVKVMPVPQGVMVLMRDISHHHRQDAFLKSTEVLMRQLVESNPHLVAILDDDWRFINVSAGWSKLFGLDEKYIKNKELSEVLKEFPKNLGSVKQSAETGKVVQRDEELISIAGQEECLKWQIRPWENAFGRRGGYLFFVDRMTEMQQTRQRLSQQLEQENKLAYNDVLTGLPNRQLFYDRLNVALAQAYRHLGKVSLMFLDLDGFKKVNDELGHDVGDMLLKSVATRLQECVRQSDTVARLGGDEFTVILNIRGPQDAEIVAKKIIDALGTPFDLSGQEVRVTTSIGICLYPADGATVSELIRKADTAMYNAKNGGKNQFKFYEEKATAEDA